VTQFSRSQGLISKCLRAWKQGNHDEIASVSVLNWTREGFCSIVWIVMSSPVEVKALSAQYISDLVKVCVDHFSWLYPECVNPTEHGTVMCPPVFSFDYTAPTGEASGATPLKEVEEATIRGDTAELKIFKILETFEQPMFVLTGLKFSEFIGCILRQKLPANHPSLSVAEGLEGEVDIAIIHRQIGVILFEVKSVPNFSKAQYGKAKKQLLKGEGVIRALLEAVDEKVEIPVYKVIAMPNVGSFTSHATESDPTTEFIDLRTENLGSLDHFMCWWKEQFVTKEFSGQETGTLQTLLSILVGQKTEITTSGGGKRLSDQVLPFKMLSLVYNAIDKQRFLQQSHHKVSGTKNPKKKAINNEVVVKTADKPNLAILEQQFLFLNREQLLIWEGPCHQVCGGEPGCGKTILLQFKALECARKGEKVVAMVPPPLENLYKDFFTRHGVSDLTQVLPLSKLANCTEFDHHWFVDEFQLLT